MLNRFSAAIGLIAVMGGLANSTNAQTPVVANAESKAIAIDQLIQSEMAARDIPGLQMAIVQNGKIVFTGAYGLANRETSAPVTNRTIFRINSISKAVTGVAAMQLVEAGKLDLDAPISTYLEKLPEAWSGVTVRQALTHTSGLPEIVDDNTRPIDGLVDPDASWARVQQNPLTFPPGAGYRYSQTNYVAMGKIIAKLSGKSFSDFVRDRQFNKVGMKQTRFAYPVSTKPDLAELYTHLTLKFDGMRTVGADRSETAFVRHEAWTSAQLLPIGGIQSTAVDLAKWVIAIQKLQLVNKTSLEELWKPQPQKDGSYRGFNAFINGYGLGWPSVRRAEHPALALTGGARATIFIYPKDDLGVVVLTNLMGASPEKFVDKIAALYIPGLAVEK
ncbi:MAG: beta-lactamase family protein [Sphingopyxis sp.]|nr:beta-lactamase family protein [Sphingopyxis sp.]